MLSVILPTMNRLELMEQAVESLFFNTTSPLELIIIVDEDRDSYEFADNHLQEKWGDKAENFQVIFNPVRIGAIAAWNLGLSLSHGDFIFPYGDDGYCQPMWLDYALETHKNALKGYGAVGLNDGAYDGNKQTITTFLYDRLFVKNVLGGVVAFPVYHYFCVDMEIQERAKNINKLVWDERAVVEHRHSAHGKRPTDSIDLYKLPWMFEDNETFRKRKELGFPNNFEPVI